MKQHSFLFLSLCMCLMPFNVDAQKIGLLECYTKAENNSPLITQITTLGTIGAESVENIGTAWKPQATLTGRVSWQSEVAGLDLNIPIPGFELPEVSKDWYKAYVDITQTIYDGGLNKASKEFELIKTAFQQQQVKVALFELRSRVNGIYFASLALQLQQEIATLRYSTLEKQHARLKSAIKNGIIHESELMQLEAEMIKAQSMIIEIKNTSKTSLAMLSFLIGEDVSDSLLIEVPVEPSLKDTTLKNSRPELELFESQKQQLEVQSEMVQKMRSPKVYGFGQVGYGRPGLNILNDAFADWYVIGIGVNWKVYDWNETRRRRNILSLQQDLITSNTENFLFQLELTQQAKWNEIFTSVEMLDADIKVKEIYTNIAKSSASRLENGVLTSADYIRDLNASTEAALKLKQRRLDIIKQKYEYLTLIGFEHENFK